MIDPPKRKRRWFQFSLLTMLLVVTASCVWLRWDVYRTEQARRTEAKIRAIEEYPGWCQSAYERTKALADVMAKGGEADLVAKYGREMSIAAADLALARGDKTLAVAELKKAVQFADEGVAAVSVNLDPVGPSPEAIHDAFAGRRDVELKLAEFAPDAAEEVRKEPGQRAK